MDVSQKTGSGLFSTSSIRFLSVPTCIKNPVLNTYRCISTRSCSRDVYIQDRWGIVHQQPSFPALPRTTKILSPLLSIQHWTRISTYIVKDRPSSIFISIQREVLRSSHAFPYFPSCPPTCRPARSSSHPSRARTREQRASISRVKVGIDMKWSSHQKVPPAKNFSLFSPLFVRVVKYYI